MVTAVNMDRVLTQAVEARVVPGVVALATDDQGLFYEGAFGQRRIDADAGMTLDTLFAIASMNKPLMAVAALQLVEQGRLALDEPLHERLPELSELQVLDGFDESGVPRLRPPRSTITLRRLLTHTAGFAYPAWRRPLLRWQQHLGGDVPPRHYPLVADPGERWEYGVGVGWVGRLVEQVSGRSLEDHFREHILDPLDMPDTRFVPGPERLARRASDHRRLPDGSLLARHTPPPEPRASYADTDLYSTGPDYVRFLRMLLGGGQLDGVRLLQPETAAELARNQIGELTVQPLRSLLPEVTHDVDFYPGMVKKWGLAGLITTQPAPTGRSVGSWAWAGVHNTYFWVDPTRRVAAVLLTQLAPFCDPAVLDLFSRFERAIYAARG